MTHHMLAPTELTGLSAEECTTCS